MLLEVWGNVFIFAVVFCSSAGACILRVFALEFVGVCFGSVGVLGFTAF